MGKIIAYFTMPHPPIIIPEVIIVVTPHGTMFSDSIALSFENSISGSLKQCGGHKLQL